MGRICSNLNEVCRKTTSEARQHLAKRVRRERCLGEVDQVAAHSGALYGPDG